MALLVGVASGQTDGIEYHVEALPSSISSPEKGREPEPPRPILPPPGGSSNVGVIRLGSWFRFNEVAAEIQPSLFSPIEDPIDPDHPLLQVVDGADERHPVSIADLADRIVGLRLEPRGRQLQGAGRGR